MWVGKFQAGEKSWNIGGDSTHAVYVGVKLVIIFPSCWTHFFRPSSTNEVPEKHTDSLYYAAEVMGKENLEYCNFAFKECSENLFDIFTRLY